MNVFTPRLIAEITSGEYVGSGSGQDIPVVGAVRDSHDVKPGNLFVCICGERTDGHLYANDAFKAGAACCLAQRELPDAKGAYVIVKSTLEAIKTLGSYHRSRFEKPVIGITGSVGKTTIKDMITAALRARLCVLKTDMNMNNELGVPLTLMALRGEHDAAVVEMGISDFGEMSRLAGMVRPDIFVITNIGYSHTKELGDLEGVLRAKTEAFAYMKKDGIAVLNGDDELLNNYDPGVKKITFGFSDNNDYRAENVKSHGADCVEMDIVCDKSRFHVKIPAYGSHLASLAPAAAAVGHLLGLSDDEISRGLSSFSHIKGRSNVSDINGITLIDDCYNANPGSVKAALVSLSELPGRRVAVLGDMLNLGSTSERLHYEIGRFAAQRGIDVLLCSGDESVHIAEGFSASGGSQVQHYPAFDQLAGELTSKIKKGDAVLVKASRGMRFERLVLIISDLKQP